MQFENITCPHCGLLCDDLSVQVEDLSVGIQAVNGSTIPEYCKSAFADASLDKNTLPSARIGDSSVSIEQAIEKSAELLRSSSMPLITGLIGDVQACRNALALAEKVGGVIDHANGVTMRNSTAVMQRIGEVKTTLAEVRNRADCIVIFGSNVLQKFPRLMDRVLNPQKTLGNEASKNKNIFILDLAKNNQTYLEEDDNVKKLFLNFNLLESLVYRLQEVVSRPKDHFKEIDNNTEQLLKIKKTILESQYTTFIWTSSEFNQESAEHTIQAITETIKTLMQKVRCVGLSLTGSKAEVTANHVSTWQTGVPLPVAFMNGTPRHNPNLFNGKTMLERNEIDTLLWISTYQSNDYPPNTTAQKIVLGHPKMKCEDAAVYIPIGVPGIDHRGLACRTDSVATLPLQALRKSELNPASEVLNKIMQLL